MFCSACGTRLVHHAKFCSSCGTPVPGSGAVAPMPAAPAPPPVPTVKPCMVCNGSGKVHRSPMSHGPGCIFCTQCPGCTGTCVVPGTATLCPKCQGQGRYHDSRMSHNGPGCIFCTDCGVCHTKGWV